MFENDPHCIGQNEYMKKEVYNLYKTKKFSDCTFYVGEEKIHAHKLILMLNSPVFEQMLYGPLSCNEIEITDIEVTEFKQMLEYMYLNKVTINSIPNAWRLLYVSRKYFLHELYQLCISYILNNLNITHLLLSYEYADFFNVKQVIKKCQHDILQFPMEVFSSNYHMKSSTFIAVLVLIYPYVSPDQIEDIISKWASDECELQDLEATEQNKMKVLQRSDVCKIHLFSDTYKYKNNEYAFMSSYHHLRLRSEYKVDRLIPFKFHCTFSTKVKVNRTVLVTGLALQIGEANLPCSLKCLVSINIIKGEEKVYSCKDILSSCYIKFCKSVMFSSSEPYNITVSYNMDTDVWCGVTTYYMDPTLKNRKNGVIFEFLDDPKGGILKGLSYYLF